MLNDAVRRLRCAQHDLSPQLLKEIRRWVIVKKIDAKSERKGDKELLARQITPFFFMFLMFMGIFAANQQMLTSVIEEKNSRVIEVLLSAVSPFR